MVKRYVGTLDPEHVPVGIERTVALKTDHAALYGRVDRIDDRLDDGLVVVDYKTGRREPSPDEARTSLSLAVYAAATQRTLRRHCRRVELHHLPSGEVVGWDHTDDGLARHLRRADSLAEEIGSVDERFKRGISDAEADELYPAHVGPLCGWCDFNRSCKIGSAFAPPQLSWAALDCE